MNSVRPAEDDARLEKVVLPHLDDSYCLARWLTGNRSEAEDVVQQAFLRAFREIVSYCHSDARVWVLAIVHRAACEWLQKNRSVVAREDPRDAEDARYGGFDIEISERELLLTEATQLKAAMEALPAPLRETIGLREILGLSYREITEVTGAPTDAIVRTLALARRRLLMTLATIAPQRSPSRQARYDQQSAVIL
jgi:RNA polymerase sigma factor (sigma-70 family)